MHLSVVGSGYVGTTIAACFAGLGHGVVNIDADESIVAAINNAEAPIHEGGLPELLKGHTGEDGTATSVLPPTTPISSTQTQPSTEYRVRT